MTNKEALQRGTALCCKNIFLQVYYKSADGIIADVVKENAPRLLEHIKQNLDWNDIDEETCRILGFSKWEDNDNVWLIPTYLYSIIPIGLKVVTIFGNEAVFNSHNDDDSRLGVLPFGIKVKENK